jgi:hypothetical protein
VEKHRTHYFFDRDRHGDDRIKTTIHTFMLPTGEYGAIDDNTDDGVVRGFGHTRLAAIADLKENTKRREDLS